jgi:hypothetical protein
MFPPTGEGLLLFIIYSAAITFTCLSQAPEHHKALPLFGNALAQYEHYVTNLTSQFSSKATWKLWTDCINVISRNGGSNDVCTVPSIEEMGKRMAAVDLHNSRVRDKNAKKADCTYRIVLDGHRIDVGGNISQTMYAVHVQPSASFLTFTIQTAQCKSEDVLSVKGGASFEVILTSQVDVTGCITEDAFTGDYHVMCPLHHNLHRQRPHAARHLQEVKPTGSSHTFKLSITLDFEHYDAFSDVYASSHLLDIPLFRGSLLVHRHGIAPKSATAQRDTVLNALNDNIRSSSHVYGQWVLDQDQDGLPRGALADFHWSGPGANFIPSKAQFLSYFGEKPGKSFASTTTHLVGASHMRYYWDLYYYLYYGAKQLGQFDRRHGYSYHIPHLVLESVLFATDMGDYFFGQKCPTKDITQVYVFQFSTWDLTFASLRNLMDNGDHMKHLVDGIRALVRGCVMKEKKEGVGSVGNLHFLWLGPTPYPKCSTAECKNRRRFNNHYAAEAVMARFTRSVQGAIESATAGSNTTFEATFDYINVKWIASVKMERRLYPCQNHLLCHPDGEMMLFSRPGLAVASELLHSIVRIIGGSTDSHTPKNKNGGIVALQAPNSRLFLRDKGLLRSVPDADTLACLNQSALGKLRMESVTASELADLPVVVTPLPSRRKGTLLVGEFSPGGAWRMQEDCTRRYVSSANAEKAAQVMEMDLEDIPTE